MICTPVSFIETDLNTALFGNAERITITTFITNKGYKKINFKNKSCQYYNIFREKYIPFELQLLHTKRDTIISILPVEIDLPNIWCIPIKKCLNKMRQ